MKILRKTNAQDHLTAKGSAVVTCKHSFIEISVNATGGECANHYNRIEFTYSEFKQVVKTAIKLWVKNKFKHSS